LSANRSFETAATSVPALTRDVVRGGRGAGLVQAGTAGVVAVTKTLTVRGVSGVSSRRALTVLVDALRAAVELAGAFAVAFQDTALLLELVDADGREVGGAMVLGRVVVDFVHGDGGVDDFGLDHFLLNDGLDSLMDVVVNMLALDDGSAALGVLGLMDNTLIAELSLLGLKSPLSLLMVAVVELAVHYAANVVLVLLRKDLTVMDWLHLAVVVVLVHFLVHGGGDLLVPGGLDSLVLHCRSNLLVDSGVVMARFGHEVLDCLLSLVHFDVRCCFGLVVG